MSRSIRIQYPGAFYHFTFRGIERKPVFLNQRDGENPLSYLELPRKQQDRRESRKGQKVRPLLSRAMTISDVARYLRVGWDTIKDIQKSDHPISTGPLEGTNNKIKTLQKRPYGFRDLDFFKLKIYALHESKYALAGWT